MDKNLLRFIFCLPLLLPALLYAQDLGLSANDLRIEPHFNGGYNLYIRYKSDISSVLITETTKDPRLQADNYAYRTAARNDINGDEIRLIDGYPIPRDSRIYSLVSSSPKQHPELGWAFHIYMPETLYYGYEGGRHGEVRVGDGTYINIRTFYYAYADYRGPFRDNPFMFRIQEEPPPRVMYMEETAAAFTAIAGKNTLYASGPDEMARQIRDILKDNTDDTDIVICLDTTGTMRPYVEEIRLQLADALRESFPATASFRIGMVLFRDYNEEYLTRALPFTSDINTVQKNLNAVRAANGGDVPEAVYEALYDGATRFSWTAPSRIMILIGDAPPHPRPRGKITRQMTETEIMKSGIQVYAIVLPELKDKR
jgi:hypothetical protein